jgi:very-short-patch-repair endonuclease
VDLADPAVKLAIEVDGETHRTAKWKALDRRKEAILAFLGWSVLRFWNEEVRRDPVACAIEIACTISALSERTITLRAAS